MSREIRFRAWDKVNNVMELDIEHLSTLNEILQKDKYLVMQFVGSEDKNKKPIFEGDVFNDVKNKLGVLLKKPSVKFENSSFILIDDYGNFEYLGFYEAETELEIIGNTHSNPELL